MLSVSEKIYDLMSDLDNGIIEKSGVLKEVEYSNAIVHAFQ